MAEEQGISLEKAKQHLTEPLPSDINIAAEAIRFAEDVVTGKIVAGDLQKKACDRFLLDLERDDISFDAAAAQKIGGYLRDSRLALRHR